MTKGRNKTVESYM
jgi:hypothetical protein